MTAQRANGKPAEGHDPTRPRQAGLATTYDEADDSPGLLMWQVTQRWQAAQRETLKPFGLTHVQFVLLASLVWLEAHPRAGDRATVSQRGLADHVRTDPMMTSQVLRALEALGLVERLADREDRRARALRATPAGRERANRAIAAVEGCDRRFFSALDAGLGVFTRSLRTLRDTSA